MCTNYASATPTDMPRLLGRRGFLRSGAMAAAAIGAAGMLKGGPAVALAQETETPDPTLTGRVPMDRVSIQLFTLRNQMSADLDNVLTTLADIGYPRVEHAGFQGRTAAEFRERTDAAGLDVTSGHQAVPFPFDELAWRRTVDAAFTMGQRAIVEPLPSFALPGFVVNQLPVGVTPSVAWGRFAESMNRAAEIAKVYGIEVGYHNHDVEFQALADAPGRTGYDILLAETDPDLVHFEMDIYWVWKAQLDPVDLLEAHGPRFRRFHVKDMDASGGITAPGAGLIDFARVFAAGEANGAEISDYIIEQDNAGNRGLETAKLGYDLLERTRW
jgi:sugar phosphate isomerase/epimerase